MELASRQRMFSDRHLSDQETAIQELPTLLDDLRSVGLHTEVRAGYGLSVLVFVQAPRELLGNTVYRSR